eukprot:m.45476 g.45476  ORF g.45476 m.45476 type:complete len:430 (+) comp6652_c0_seq1:201-1490(+)
MYWSITAGATIVLGLLWSVHAGTPPLPPPASDYRIPAGWSYHNVATLGPSPRVVTQALVTTAQDLETNPAQMYFGGGDVTTPSTKVMEAVRVSAAAALNAFLNETAVMPSTTVSLNRVAAGLVSSGYVKAGDRVLTTDQEHAGGLECWRHFVTEQPLLASFDSVAIPVNPPPTSTDAILALFEAALKNHTYRVVAVSHVTTTNGLRLPLKELADMVHAHGAILIVDGAQAHGGVAVDVKALGVDAYATSSHKWLLSAKGSGLLYISSSIRSNVTPTFFDGGMQPYTASSGTRPVHTLAGLGAAIDYMNQWGFDAIEAHNMQLRNLAYTQFVKLTSEIPGLTMVSPPPGPLASPIITLGLPGNVTSAGVANAMAEQFKTVVKVTGHAVFPEEGGPTMPLQATRFTFHLFNSQDDVSTLVHNFGTVVKSLL